jgi:hypothetical protein
MSVEIGTEAAQFPFLGIHKWDFRCSVQQDLAWHKFICVRPSPLLGFCLEVGNKFCRFCIWSHTECKSHAGYGLQPPPPPTPRGPFHLIPEDWRSLMFEDRILNYLFRRSAGEDEMFCWNPPLEKSPLHLKMCLPHTWYSTWHAAILQRRILLVIFLPAFNQTIAANYTNKLVFKSLVCQILVFSVTIKVLSSKMDTAEIKFVITERSAEVFWKNPLVTHLWEPLKKITLPSRIVIGY